MGTTGMIIQANECKKAYRFSHDLIRQAAFLLVPESMKNDMSWDIGMKLLKLLSEDEKQKNIFTIIKLIDPALDKEMCEQMRSKISMLYLYAGKKCLSST